MIAELVRRNVPLWLESPLQIKLSFGLQRGKNDKLDSFIAQYAYTRHERRLWQPPRQVIEHLKQLRGLRERLLSAKLLLKAETKELSGFVERSIAASVAGHCQMSLRGA